MKSVIRIGLVAAIVPVLGFFFLVGKTRTVSANMSPQTLPFVQNWTTTTLITADDDWMAVPGIAGFRGDDLTATTGTDPRTIVADGSATPLDVIANQSSPGTLTTGGVAEFDGIANPVVAFQGSGTADAPHIVIYLNTTGMSNIRVQYNARDVDDQTNNDADQQINTQVRVGGTGDYANVSGGYIADATTDGQSDVTPVDVLLPSGADNQALVEVRIMTTNAPGSDEWIGIDDINITSSAAPSGTAHADFDGDGKTDYSIVRNTAQGLIGDNNGQGMSIGERLLQNKERVVISKNQDDSAAGLKYDSFGDSPPAGSGLQWWAYLSGSGTTGFATLGTSIAADARVPADYDGDGRTDIAVWRGNSTGQPSGNGHFFIFNTVSSTLTTVDFGQQGDNPTIVGDYDGDGKADPAVFRCPTGGGQCFFYYKGSAGSGGITYVPWGNNTGTNSRAIPGDYDGDGKLDFMVAQNSGGTNVNFLLRSSDFGIEYIYWGLGSDPIRAPGDYDGDGKDDLMYVRVVSNNVQWWLLERDGGSSVTQFGALLPAYAEFTAQGDYDGDGKNDIAIWRRNNSDPTDTFFYVLRSSDGMLQTFEWGQPGDVPVPGWNSN